MKIAISTFLLLLPLIALAELPDILPGIDSFGELVAEGVGKIIPIAISLSVLMFIYAGFLFVSAGGDEGKIKTAKSVLKWAVVGAFVLIGAWALAEGYINSVERL